MDFASSRSVGQTRRPRLIEEGDLLVVYERHDSLDHFYAKAGEIYNNKFGAFHHNDMIGKPYGSRIASRHSSGWVYVLLPTPELWATAVHTRTQIVNEVDSSVVTMMLDVYPGCRVVESGTGSGCMTLSLARAVYPNGHVFTFEYNGVRAEKAREEFQRLKVSDLITVTHRDVCGKYMPDPNGDLNGGSGGFSGIAPHTVDAVFLDLPEPWLALEGAKKVLKMGRNICCYSPCIEQVMKTCEKLRELGFHSIRMIEVRQRPFDARVVDMETVDLGLSPEEEALNNKSSRDPNNFFQKGRPPSKSNASYCRTYGSTNAPQGNGNGNNESDNEEGSEQEDDREDTEEVKDQSNKRQRTEEVVDGATTDANTAPRMSLRKLNCPKSAVTGDYTMQVARPLLNMKGHTAFLTFAIRSLTE